MKSRLGLAVLACCALVQFARPALASQAEASGFGSSAPGAFAPQVPVSAFARPASWLDMSRLHVTTSFSMGSGFAGGTNALQVTSLSYQLGSPLSLQVSVGNSFGSGAPGRSMFLEGFSVAYRPHPSLQINVDYRDIRSPLQYGSASPFGYYGPSGR